MAVTTTFLKIELQGVDKATQQAGAFSNAIKAAETKISGSNRAIGESVAKALGGAGDFLTGLGALVGNRALNKGIADIVTNVNDSIKQVKNGITDAADTIENVFSRIERILIGRGLVNGFKFLRGHSDAIASGWNKVLPVINATSTALGSYSSQLVALGAGAAQSITPMAASFGALQTRALTAGSAMTTLRNNSTAALQSIKSITATSTAANVSFAAFSAGSKGATALLTTIKPAAVAAAGGFAAMAKAAGAAALAALKTPLGALVVTLGALTAATTYYFNSIKEEMRVYQDLNPEIETAISLYDRLNNEAEAAATATAAVWGAADNETFKIYIQDLVGLWTKLKTNINQVLALLFSSDSIWPKLKADATAAISIIMGTISTAIESVLPKRLTKVLGINTDFWVDARQRAEKEADAYFSSTETGKLWAEQWEKAYSKIANSAKDTGAAVSETTKILKQQTEQAPAEELLDWGDWGETAFSGLDIAAELAAEKERERQQKLADQIFTIEAEKAAKIQQIKEMTGDTPEALAAQNALIEQITQQAATREKEIKIAAAQEVGDYKLHLADQLAALEEQQAQATLASWQQVGDYLQGTAKSSLESLAQTGLNALYAWAEGTGDWRQAMYEGFQSLGKNLIQTGLTEIINTAFQNQAKAAESQYSIPYVGPILAIAAGAAALASTMALKNKLQKPKISYANGGYISAGLVKGGAANLDSVTAALMPGERVLSKKEAEEYVNNQRALGAVFNINIRVSGQLSTPEKVTETVRRVLIPEIRRAVQQGYSLG